MAYLTQLREAYPQITELGAEALGIASKPASLDQTVLDSGHQFPLLMDPEYTFRTSATTRQHPRG